MNDEAQYRCQCCGNVHVESELLDVQDASMAKRTRWGCPSCGNFDKYEVVQQTTGPYDIPDIKENIN